MAHISPQKRLAKTAGFIRLATRQIQDRTPDLALKTLNNAANEIKVLLKDPKTDDVTIQLDKMTFTDIVAPLIQWHENNIEAIDTLITHADKPMDFGNNRTRQLKPNDVAAFRQGATFAKILIGEFPLKMTAGAEDDDE